MLSIINRIILCVIMRSLVEVHQRLRELKANYASAQERRDNSLYYDNENELNGIYNRIQELNWVLGITD